MPKSDLRIIGKGAFVLQGLDLQRLRHIQTHCRNILYYVGRCNGKYESFRDNPACVERVRSALYHIGELSELMPDDCFASTKSGSIPWNAVILWAKLRTQKAESLDKLWLWHTANEVIPQLVEDCADLVDEVLS